MSKFASSFIPELHFITARLAEPSLRDALGAHGVELVTLEQQLSALHLEAEHAKHTRAAAFDAVKVAAEAVDVSLEPLAGACIAARVGTLSRPFGPDAPSASTLRRKRAAAKSVAVRGVLQSHAGVSPELDTAVAMSLSKVVALEAALDAATTADHAAAQIVEKRNALCDRTRTKLTAVKRFAALALAGRPEGAVFRRALPSLVRPGRRLRSKDDVPSPLPVPPTGEKPVTPTA